jgi:hypothetical protein
MTDRDPEPSRTLLSMQAFRRRALAEIRQQLACSGVLDIAINLVTDVHRIPKRSYVVKTALRQNGKGPLPADPCLNLNCSPN